jgi:hypothetical protein
LLLLLPLMRKLSLLHLGARLRYHNRQSAAAAAAP